MAEQAGELNQEEKQTRNEMLFTLSERDLGTLAMVVTPNEGKRNELYRWLKDHLEEYTFFDLDLTAHTYSSLFKALQELLPSAVLQSQPVQYVVNVMGLENSLYTTEDGKIEFSPLVAQMNFERELLFNQPYLVLLWVSEGFDRELRRKAPDLMQWMSKRFVFEEKGPDGMEVAEEAVMYGPVRKKGKVPERLERIRQLEETWEKLTLHSKDQTRLVKDKIDLLLLMGKEYAAAFEFGKAEAAFEKAITLNNKIQAGKEIELYYSLGGFYYNFKRYDLALKYFQQAFEIAQKVDDENIGIIYHMMGMAYGGQRKWKEALASYGQALEWYKKTGNEYTLGNTYHEFGRVYEQQRKWDEALNNYGSALKWYEKTGNEYEMGYTYHHIGIVYQEQGKWDEALANYRRALEWQEKTGNEFGLGYTYHQIGSVYEQQGKWDEALANYRSALEWKEKTGNEYKLGSTYHQIGRFYEEQNMLSQARDWFEKSLENDTRFDHPDLPISQASLARIQKKIADQNQAP